MHSLRHSRQTAAESSHLRVPDQAKSRIQSLHDLVLAQRPPGLRVQGLPQRCHLSVHAKEALRSRATEREWEELEERVGGRGYRDMQRLRTKTPRLLEAE